MKLYKNAVLARENRDQKIREKERQASLERHKLLEKELEEMREKQLNDDTVTINTNIDGGTIISPISIICLFRT